MFKILQISGTYEKIGFRVPCISIHRYIHLCVCVHTPYFSPSKVNTLPYANVNTGISGQVEVSKKARQTVRSVTVTMTTCSTCIEQKQNQIMFRLSYTPCCNHASHDLVFVHTKSDSIKDLFSYIAICRLPSFLGK